MFVYTCARVYVPTDVWQGEEKQQIPYVSSLVGKCTHTVPWICYHTHPSRPPHLATHNHCHIPSASHPSIHTKTHIHSPTFTLTHTHTDCMLASNQHHPSTLARYACSFCTLSIYVCEF